VFTLCSSALHLRRRELDYADAGEHRSSGLRPRAESEARHRREDANPKEIKPFGGGVTLDSSSGGIVRGFSYADPTPNAGVRELRDELTAAMEDGHKRALLILDGGYQFAVSIGVYVQRCDA